VPAAAARVCRSGAATEEVQRIVQSTKTQHSPTFSFFIETPPQEVVDTLGF